MNAIDWAPGEQAMFLAQVFHESGGLIKIEEEKCVGGNKCVNNYPSQQGGLPGKSYHGRGFMQLTWDYNYKVDYFVNQIVNDSQKHFLTIAGSVGRTRIG